LVEFADPSGSAERSAKPLEGWRVLCRGVLRQAVEAWAGGPAATYECIRSGPGIAKLGEFDIMRAVRGVAQSG
jgi:hypothetical protein